MIRKAKTNHTVPATVPSSNPPRIAFFSSALGRVGVLGKDMPERLEFLLKVFCGSFYRTTAALCRRDLILHILGIVLVPPQGVVCLSFLSRNSNRLEATFTFLLGKPSLPKVVTLTTIPPIYERYEINSIRMFVQYWVWQYHHRRHPLLADAIRSTVSLGGSRVQPRRREFSKMRYWGSVIRSTISPWLLVSSGTKILTK